MKHGFTLIEAILGLFFSSLVLILILMISQSFYRFKENTPTFDQNKIGLIQLQNELTLSHNFELNDSGICYEKFENNYCLQFDKDRLVKTPGYEIFLINIKEGRFVLEAQKLHLLTSTFTETLHLIP